ncbi:MAG: hypothetical protein KBC47_02675 [Candidatus Peribacteraceae bacterium]|nr:hypothetical protein [Candidatus Peribacteraceae bacterium]
MPLPEYPELRIGSTTSTPQGVRDRVIHVAAAMSLLFLTSMNRPEFTEIVDTKISIPATSDVLDSDISQRKRAALKIQVTVEQQAQLDDEIQACFSLATLGTYGTVTMFTVAHPRPEAEDLKGLLDSVPENMRPHIIRIAKLVALHPAECDRVKEALLKKVVKVPSDENMAPKDQHLKVSFSENEEQKAWRLSNIRNVATSLLRLCKEHDDAFESELLAIGNAEFMLRNNSQELARVDK